MTKIKVTCPQCGDVDITVPQIHVQVSPQMGWSTYQFTCNCGDEIVKEADDEIVSLLRSVGVEIVEVEVPAEALETHSGDPVCHDEVLDFAEFLAENDFLVPFLEED